MSAPITEEEMTDSEMWKIHKEQGQQKRASNRENSAQILKDAGIQFESKNGGAHLIVRQGPSPADRVINFWPGTGLWMQDGTKSAKQRNYGVHNLIHFIRNKP